ncbi:MAG: hypothetical protein ACRDJI_06590 [Actinomycetota bacterium]
MSEDAKTWLIVSAIVVAMVITSFVLYAWLTESNAEECERAGGTWDEDSRSCGGGSP